MGLKHVALFSLLLMLACSSGHSPETTPVPQNEQQKTGTGEPAQGIINGQNWVFRSGRASYKKPQNKFLIVQLWNELIEDPCNEKRGSTLQIRVTAPAQEATWAITPEDPFNANLSIFFADLDMQLQPRDNMRADHGEITFFSIEPQGVTGTIQGSFQNPRVGGTRVHGDFSVPFCP